MSGSAYEEYLAKHDWLSQRFAWHRQRTNENFLDLSGFIASISGDLEPEQLADSYSIPLGHFEVEQPSRIRYTHLIYIFTLFERRIHSLAKVIKECDSGVLEGLNDFRGSLFNRFGDFMEKSAEIRIRKDREWNAISTLQKLRDCILHCGGRICESRDEQFLLKLCNSGKDVTVSQDGYLRISKNYCDEITHSICDFIDELFTDYHRTIRSRINPDGTRNP